MSSIQNVYNHYLTAYTPKKITRFDSHKKSELKKLYTSILKFNKEAPLYKVKCSDDMQKFAIDIKENAREVKNTIQNLSSDDSLMQFNKKVAYSNDDSVVSVKYIGESNQETATEGFDIEIQKLAQNQQNLGRFVPSDDHSLTPGAYSFNININDLDYEFQFQIQNQDTNKAVQTKIASIINRANIGIAADVVKEDSYKSALRLSSTATGAPAAKRTLFEVTDNDEVHYPNVIDYFSMNHVTQYPSDSSFLLNGTPRSTSLNSFTLGNSFEISLKGLSAENNSARIAFKNDTDAIADNLSLLTNAYNSFLKIAEDYKDTQPRSSNLSRELGSIARHYRSDLESVGIMLEEDGRLSIDKGLIEQSDPEEFLASLSNINNFKNSLNAKSTQILINPMEYVDKTIVLYKNPGKNFLVPYSPSMYSGMLFNSYC